MGVLVILIRVMVLTGSILLIVLIGTLVQVITLLSVGYILKNRLISMLLHVKLVLLGGE